MYGWFATAVTVIAYDAWAIKTRRDTMSAVARRHPALVPTAMVAFAAHLWLRRPGRK